jgi:hypothetical protein
MESCAGCGPEKARLAMPTSGLNSYNGYAVSNAGLVPAGGTDSVSVFATSATDVLIDTAGYFGQ